MVIYNQFKQLAFIHSKWIEVLTNRKEKVMKELEMLKKKIDALEKEMIIDNENLEFCIQECSKRNIKDCINIISDLIKWVKYIKSL